MLVSKRRGTQNICSITKFFSPLSNFNFNQKNNHKRNYTLILTPKHIVPKTWSTFEQKLNIEYIEKYNDDIFQFLGLNPNTIDFSVNASLFEGLPYYDGKRLDSDQILVEYLADKADRLAKLDTESLSPFSTDYILRALFFHISTKYFYQEIGLKEKPFMKPVTLPLWLLTSKSNPGDVEGTDIRHFKDRHEHVFPEITLEKVFAHTIHRHKFSEDDFSFLKEKILTIEEEKQKENQQDSNVESQLTDAQIRERISTIGLITMADVTDLAYHNIPDTFDFGRMRSIINYGTYHFNPIMPMITVTGSLVKFSIGLFDKKYCEACTEVAQHATPSVSAKVIGFCGSDDPNGWNILRKEERDQAIRYIIALKKFASLPLREMKTVEEALKLL